MVGTRCAVSEVWKSDQTDAAQCVPTLKAMPFDPNKPAANSPNSSAEMRGQLTSLKSLIDAVPGITDVMIDSVNTLNPEEPAIATASIIGTVLHLTFAIPRGDDGVQGPAGVQGPPFANAIVDAVNTLPAGSAATVSVSFDGTNVHFTFGIPIGADGAAANPQHDKNGTGNRIDALMGSDVEEPHEPSKFDYYRTHSDHCRGLAHLHRQSRGDQIQEPQIGKDQGLAQGAR